MERSLKLWIDDHHRKNIPVNLSIIPAKALSLHDDLKNPLGGGRDVPVSHAGKGWFDRFQARACLHNIKLTDEAASAYKEAAREFINTFSQTIEEGDYSLRQIFNVDDTGQF